MANAQDAGGSGFFRRERVPDSVRFAEQAAQRRNDFFASNPINFAGINTGEKDVSPISTDNPLNPPQEPSNNEEPAEQTQTVDTSQNRNAPKLEIPELEEVTTEPQVTEQKQEEQPVPVATEPVTDQGRGADKAFSSKVNSDVRDDETEFWNPVNTGPRGPSRHSGTSSSGTSGPTRRPYNSSSGTAAGPDMLFPTDWGGTTIGPNDTTGENPINIGTSTRQAYEDMLAGNSNPLADAIVGIGNVGANVLDNMVSPGFESPLLDNVGINIGMDVADNLGRYADVVRDYNNDLSDIPSQNPYETIIDYPTETPFEPAPPAPVVEPVDLSTTEQAYTSQDMTNPVNPAAESQSANYNPFANMSTYDETADRLAREQYERGTREYTAYDNPFMNNSMLGNESFNIADPFASTIPNNDMQDLEDAYNSLPGSMTDWQKQEFMWQAYNDPINFKPDPGIVAGMEPPQLDANGNPNYTLSLLLNTKDYIADDGTNLRVGEDGQFYKPGDDKPVDPSEVTVVPHYDADTIFQTFVDLPKTTEMENGGQVVWKQPILDLLNDPTLTQEERDGLNALLVTKFWGGTTDGRFDYYPQEFFDGTDDQYNYLANLLIDKLGLTDLINNGVMTASDVRNFFLKAPKSESKSPKGNGTRNYGYGRGGYGRGGYGGGGGGGGGGSRGGNYTPTAQNQNSNRIYNIMKNWSF